MEPDPFYFGAPDEPLFGLHYAPRSPRALDVGILLCYPVGHEYIVAHRAYRQLSIRLAEAGFHVIRFDYYASGDSAGECEHGSPQRWMRDIGATIGELRSRTRCDRVCLVGCRLGATFGALVGAERGDVEHAVLWDPVVNGGEHVREISRRHQDMLRQTHVKAPPSPGNAGTQELLGIAVSEATLREIAAIDLLSISRQPAQQILLIESRRDDTTGPLRQRLTNLGSRITYERIAVPHAWNWIEDPSTILVPHRILTSVITWITQVHS